MNRYVVVDQNVLRKPTLARVIAEEPYTHFVLPDLAFLELTKSAQWESTLQQSLQQLSAVPRRVHVAYSVNEALSTELRTLRSSAGHMLNARATRFGREVLSWVGTGAETDAVRQIRSDPENHKAGLALDFLNHDENKTQYGELIDATKKFIPAEVQKLMRNGKLDNEGQSLAVHELATGLLPEILAERSISRERAKSFMKTRPMVFRYLLIKAWYCVHWISRGGFESLRDANVTNELVDQQYVLTGSFFDGLLSDEKRVNESFKDLSALLRRKV